MFYVLRKNGVTARLDESIASGFLDINKIEFALKEETEASHVETSLRSISVNSEMPVQAFSESDVDVS